MWQKENYTQAVKYAAEKGKKQEAVLRLPPVVVELLSSDTDDEEFSGF